MRIIFILLALAGAEAWARCGDLPGGLRYCIYETAGSVNPDVIYYLHGRFGKAERWAETDFYTEEVRQDWKARGVQAPRVVSLSFGPVWLLAEKNGSPYSGLFEVMNEQVIPAMEQILGGTRGKRIIMGESMGGFNTLQLALKTGWFHKAASLCAPIAAHVDPFSSLEEIDRFIRQSAAYAYYGETNRREIDEKVSEILSMAKAVWQDRANWRKSDPLLLAQSLESAVAPSEFYINAGFYDPFALYEGNLELVKRLLLKEVKTEWRPEWGGHCKIDIPSLSRFLVE